MAQHPLSILRSESSYATSWLKCPLFFWQFMISQNAVNALPLNRKQMNQSCPDGVSHLHPQRVMLDNGITLVVTENPVADIVATRFFLDAGSRYEPIEKAGLMSLMAALLTKGTAQWSAREIAALVEESGASLGLDSAPDYFLISAKTVSEDFLTILQLITALLRQPSFPESELELERKITLQSLRARQEQPMAIALENLRQSLYGEHPYALAGAGTLETVAQLTRDDLCRFHSRFFQPQRLVISVAGNITAVTVVQHVESLLGDWSPQKFDLDPSIPTFPLTKPTSVVAVKPTQQAIVMFGYPAPNVFSPDYPALRLLHAYLCNGLSSRLFMEIREKRGLAYEVSGFYPTRRDPSHFVVYLGTAAANTALASELLHSELARLSAQSLSEEDLKMTQRKLLGQYALGKQTNHQIAHLLGWYERLGLGTLYDEKFVQAIGAVTAPQLQAAATRYLQQPYVSVVGPEDAVSNFSR
jgi:zinc protease